ncbi:MAG: 4Fe-4S dicluster domain-containing protein, partial [Candidatus Thorarchaeota archaeon]
MSSNINNKIKSNIAEYQISEKSAKNIISMANYCYACNRCVNVCPTSHLGIFSPRLLIEDLAISSLGDVLNNHNIWNCLTCGQCTIYCPMTQENLGVRIPELILELRKVTRNIKIQIDRINLCETHNDIFPFISKMMANNQITPKKLKFLEEFNLKTTDSGQIAFYIG